jgi:hypothetical protein
MPDSRRKFDPEFREGAGRIVRETGKPIAQIARDLGVHPGTLGNWVATQNRSSLRRPPDRLLLSARSPHPLGQKPMPFPRTQNAPTSPPSSIDSAASRIGQHLDAQAGRECTRPDVSVWRCPAAVLGSRGRVALSPRPVAHRPRERDHNSSRPCDPQPGLHDGCGDKKDASQDYHHTLQRDNPAHAQGAARSHPMPTHHGHHGDNRCADARE